MVFALDLVLAFLSLIAAVPLLMQLRCPARYERFVDADGNVVAISDGGMAPDELDGAVVTRQIVSVHCVDGEMPKEEGWAYVESGPLNFTKLFCGACGALLILAAFSLVFRPALPLHYLAWALMAGSAWLIVRDLPRIWRLKGQGAVPWTNFLYPLMGALGAIAASRML